MLAVIGYSKKIIDSELVGSLLWKVDEFVLTLEDRVFIKTTPVILAKLIIVLEG